MGVVYKAHDTRLERDVALKFLPFHFGNDGGQKQRFIQEAKAASALDHPNICTIHEVSETSDGQTFICMAFYEGETLKEKIGRKTLKLEEAIGFAVQVASGLAAAHAKGIVHRDIKPLNIMVTQEGRVKILDFGIAKLAGKTGHTKEGAALGTVEYMSPEQAQGKTVDQRTDIWSLGVVLYEMVSGQAPFRSDYEQATIYSILNEHPRPIAGLRGDRLFELEGVIGKCLQKEPDSRYQRADELAAGLRKIDAGFNQTAGTAAALVKAIAVLPFENISPDKENEYFSDGLTEEIIANLSKIRTLKVISRTSAMRYKGSNKPLSQIALELRVQYVLEGSVRQQGNDLRITAQLIEATQDVHLWAEKYRGTMEDVFEIQEKVAGEIAKALEVQLTPNEQQGLKKRQTEDTEAYQLYLKGRYFWNKRNEEGLKKGIEYFEQAIEKDPEYALAYSGLADSYTVLAAFTLIAPKEALPKIRTAALNALKMDEILAEAHISLAWSKCWHDRDWSAAEREFKWGIEHKPNYATGHHWYALFLTAMGRYEEALAAIKQALELDPFSLIINTNTGFWVQYFAREYNRAINQLQKTLDMDANFAMAHYGLALTYNEAGRYAEAIFESQKALQLTSGRQDMKAVLGYSYARAGNREEAEKILEELKRVRAHQYVSSYSIALIHLALGDGMQALEELEKAFEEQAIYMIWIKIDPRLDLLRTEPRFVALLQKMGFEKR